MIYSFIKKEEKENLLSGSTYSFTYDVNLSLGKHLFWSLKFTRSFNLIPNIYKVVTMSLNYLNYHNEVLLSALLMPIDDIHIK